MLSVCAALWSGTAAAETMDNVAYLDWNPSTGGFDAKSADGCTVVDANTTALDGGWYVVAAGSDIKTVGSVAVNGTPENPTRLILADGGSWTVSVTDNAYGSVKNKEGIRAGVAVPEGKALVIYGQAGGSGVLTAYGSYYGEDWRRPGRSSL